MRPKQKTARLWVVVQFEIHRAGNQDRPVGNCGYGKWIQETALECAPDRTWWMH